MKKKFLRIFAGALAVSFAFGASGCAHKEEQEEIIKGTPEENAAFAVLKAAYEHSSVAWQTKGLTASGVIKAAGNDSSVEESVESKFIVSVDVENKIGFSETEASESVTGEYIRQIEKLFKQDGEYYAYSELSQSSDQSTDASPSTIAYQPITSIPLEYLFETLERGQIWYEFGFLEPWEAFDCFFVSGAFLAKDFDTLKKGYAELAWEMSERQRKRICGWSLEEIANRLPAIDKSISERESLLREFYKNYSEEEIQAKLNENGEIKWLKEQKEALINSVTPEAEKIKADISVTAYEKDGYATLEIKSKMQSNWTEKSGELEMTLQIKAKDGKIVGGYRSNDFNKWENEEKLVGAFMETEIEISEEFAQEKYDEIETVVTADTELEEVRDITLDKDLTLDIDGLSYPMEFEINSQTSVEELFADWTKGIYFRGQFDEEEGEEYKCVTWEDLYLDEAKTQKFNPASVTLEEFLKIEKLYTGFTINDGYAVFVTSTHYLNGLSEKDKYLFVQNSEIEDRLDVHFEFRKLKAQEGKKESPYNLFSYSSVGTVQREHGDDAEVYVNGQRITDRDYEFEFEVKNKGYTKVKVIAYEKNRIDWWYIFDFWGRFGGD